MKILKVEINNFKSFNKVTLPESGYLRDGLFLIRGDNSMGKTSFMEAMLWCILGDKIISGHKSLFVRQGQSSCRVDVTFELEDNIYKVVRKIISRKSKKSNSDLEYPVDASLSKQNGDTFSIMYNGVRRVNSEIQNLLGLSDEDILKTVYVKQKEVDSLATAEPAKLRTLVTSLFGLGEFDNITKRLKDRIININESINNLSRDVGRLDIEQNELGKQKHRVTEIQANLDEINKQVAESKHLKSQLFDLERLRIITHNVGIIDDVSNKLQIHEEKIKSQRVQTQNRQSRIESLESEISTLDEEITTINDLVNSLMDENKLRHIDDINNDILNITEQIINQRKKINVELESLSSEYILQLIKQMHTKITTLTKEQSLMNETLNQLRQTHTEEKLLVSMKHESLDYIKNHKKCPVCERDMMGENSTFAKIKSSHESHKSKTLKLNNEIIQLEKQIDTINLDISDKNNIHDSLDRLTEPIDTLEQKKSNLHSTLKSYDVDTIDALLSKIGNVSISEAIDQRRESENKLSVNKKLIQAKRQNLEEERSQSTSGRTDIEELEMEKAQLNDQKVTANKDILKQLKPYSSLDELLKQFSCYNITELENQHRIYDAQISEQTKQKTSTKNQLDDTLVDLVDREDRIKLLILQKKKLENSKNKLRHMKFLKGEINGFLSIHVIEGKIVEILKEATNHYLLPFSNRRYRVHEFRSISKRVKDMESHGLEITLFDEHDNMMRTKTQISGGDETALGLALRLAISKIMGRIRPFKNSETHPPLVNMILLDEPMGSLDVHRRRELMNILVSDASFSQIFLITHTDIDVGDSHSIQVSSTNQDKQLEFTPMQV